MLDARGLPYPKSRKSHPAMVPTARFRVLPLRPRYSFMVAVRIKNRRAAGMRRIFKWDRAREKEKRYFGVERELSVLHGGGNSPKFGGKTLKSIAFRRPLLFGVM